MKRFYLLLLAGWLLFSCGRLPTIHPVAGFGTTQIHAVCNTPFPEGKWQFLHSIETSLPGGKKGFVMGVTVISSTSGAVHCVIMTVEGFVLFDAAYSRQLVINRGLPPFDSEDFAEGLINDIKLIFFKPSGVLVASGRTDNGLSVCRYQNSDGRLIDVITNDDAAWKIRQFGRDFHLLRTVKGFPSSKASAAGRPEIPHRIELTAHGSPEYALVLNLVEAVSLTP